MTDRQAGLKLVLNWPHISLSICKLEGSADLLRDPSWGSAISSEENITIDQHNLK